MRRFRPLSTLRALRKFYTVAVSISVPETCASKLARRKFAVARSAQRQCLKPFARRPCSPFFAANRELPRSRFHGLGYSATSSSFAMAAPPPPIAVTNPALAAPCLIFIPANSPIVANTPAAWWYPAPAGPGGAPRVATPTYRAIQIAIPVLRISRVPAEPAATQTQSPLNTGLSDAAWARFLAANDLAPEARFTLAPLAADEPPDAVISALVCNPAACTPAAARTQSSLGIGFTDAAWARFLTANELAPVARFALAPLADDEHPTAGMAALMFNPATRTPAATLTQSSLLIGFTNAAWSRLLTAVELYPAARFTLVPLAADEHPDAVMASLVFNPATRTPAPRTEVGRAVADRTSATPTTPLSSPNAASPPPSPLPRRLSQRLPR